QMLTFITHFIPLEEGWHAMHWESDTYQEYALVRFSDDRLVASDLAPLKERIEKLGKEMGISFQPDARTRARVKEVPNEIQMIRLLDAVSTLPQTPGVTMTRVPVVPANIVNESMSVAAKWVSALDARYMQNGR